MSQSDARYNCGQQFSFCRFTRMSFLPLLFQRRCLARFRLESLGEVSHSAGHSVVNWQNKKPIHRDIKNRREFCSRFKMMKLCIGSVNSETNYLLINHSASRFTFMSGAALLAAAISSYFEVSFCIKLLFFDGIILLYITKHMFVNTFEEGFE